MELPEDDPNVLSLFWKPFLRSIWNENVIVKWEAENAIVKIEAETF